MPVRNVLKKPIFNALIIPGKHIVKRSIAIMFINRDLKNDNSLVKKGPQTSNHRLNKTIHNR